MAYFKGGDGACVLTRLLGAAALAEPELGYVQGMNYVAAFILVVLSHAAENDVVETPRRTQVRAFSTLRGATRLLRGYYEPGFCMLKRDVAVFEALLEKHEPKLAEALLASGVDAITYAPRFLMPIFLNALPGAVNARLWDVLLSSCCGEVGDVHSDAASAVLLWALLAVCHAAAPAALALAHDRRGDDPTSFFVDLQDVLLDAAASTPSWERLCRAPVSVENVLDAISAHGRADAAPPSPADVLPEDAPAAAEAPRREQFPRTFDLLRRLVVPPRFVDSRWRGREQPYRYNPSRPYRYSPLAATPHARGTNVEMTPTNDAWPAPTNDATIADFERAMV
ncbi:rab-GTPase-TBC domain-containing protein [Pelagophyceae sp. CCMP2097]|nr:rab-GTPase-TBC domain-containing protein [Pelagophyceae sp. CCMP2097]